MFACVEALRNTLRTAIIPDQLSMLRHLSILRTTCAALRNRALKIWVYRRASVVLHQGSVVGPGKLVFGAQWKSGIFRPSQLVLRQGAVCQVEGTFRIHEGASIWINQSARITLGSGYINSGVNISISGSLTIGHDVAIAENVTIWDADGHEIQGRAAGPQPVNIGNHVWIGLNTTILKGVTIGDGAVIAAGALVNRDIPAGMLAAGVPARPIRQVIWS
ncbi:acyltransferase [Roseomonas sp. KE2513]|uniref:acyltransferase n=1 Tax=Roseomonas sp. KE2513 TaxID=2479202 RepID=UPI002814FDA7|nr:acyltransferase [Roseomonas sp. KE2513]MBI0535080.1 acyltransferase [Roseomonas sp. KE2513]